MQGISFKPSDYRCTRRQTLDHQGADAPRSPFGARWLRAAAASILLLALVAAGAPAQVQVIESQGDSHLTRYRLTVEAAAEPNPPLKYELMPGYWERRPGNAAPFYYRALLMQTQLPKESSKQYDEYQQQWTKGALNDASKAELRKWLSAYDAQVGEQLRTAVYRETCDFDHRVQDLDGMKAIAFLLPECQQVRSLARMLRVKARLDIADGRLDEAVETLRMGFQLVHDVGQQRFLVSQLVGIACASINLESLPELMAAPRAPNLYWAIAALPRPLVDMNRGLQYERGLAVQMFPFLKDAETAVRSPEEWQRILLTAARQFQELGGSGPQAPEWQGNLAVTGVMLKAYPQAKRRLIAAGFEPKRVEAMPVGQVVAIQTARVTRYAYEEMLKWSLLPYEQSLARTRESEEKLRREKILERDLDFSQGSLPLAQLLLPALGAVRHAEARLERDLAGLQAVEAIRWHAAANAGRLPAKWEDVSVVPVPLNPVTGRAFPYRVENSVAILDLPAVGAKLEAKRFEISIRAKK
jgi:hypothetical protein